MEEENKKQESLKEKIENADSFGEMKEVVKDKVKTEVKKIKPFKMIKCIVVFLIAAVLLFCVLFTYKTVFNKSKSNHLSIVNTIDDIINIEEISVIEYPYTGVIKVKIDDEAGPQLVNTKEEADCFVKFNAKIMLGIDYKKVSHVIDEDKKEIIFKMPKVVNLGPNGDDFNIKQDYETIVKNKRANSFTIEQKRKLINQYLQKNAIIDDTSGLISLTQENIEKIIKDLMLSIDKTYQIIFDWEK